MKMDFPLTHIGCKLRSQSGTVLPNTRSYFAATAKLTQSILTFPSALVTLSSHRSLHKYQYLLQREIFTAFLPLLALYKRTHRSFGAFERNNTDKHLPVTGHKKTCHEGQRGAEYHNETPRQRQDGTAGWPGSAG